MKKIILLLSILSSFSLISCAHKGHNCGDGTCNLEKSGCTREKEKSGGCKDCDDKAESKAEEKK